MPFADFKDFADCVRQNQDKDDPEAFCAFLEKQTTGKFPSEMAEHNGTARRRLLGVEIFAVGDHIDMDGKPLHIEAADLEQIVAAFNAGIPQMVPVKFGHTSAGFNAQAVADMLGIPVGLVTGGSVPPEFGGGDGTNSGGLLPGEIVRLERRQNKLLADMDVLGPVADMVQRGMLRFNSVEILRDFQGQPWVISAVALLGTELPAVKGLAPLQAAAMLRAGAKALVYAFSMGKPRGYLDLNATDIEATETALETALKGQRGAGFIRQVWQDIKAKIAARSEHKEEPDMEEKAIREALGIGKDADLLVAVKGLRAWETVGREALGATATPEALKTKLTAGASSAFSESRVREELATRDTTIKAQGDEIVKLRNHNRLSAFREATGGLTLVSGKPEELAQTLMDTEDKMGEPAMKARLAEWSKLQELAEKAGVDKRIGSNGTTAPAKHAFTEMVEKVAAEKKISVAKAHAQLALSEPVLWNSYRNFRYELEGS